MSTTYKVTYRSATSTLSGDVTAANGEQAIGAARAAWNTQGDGEWTAEAHGAASKAFVASLLLACASTAHAMDAEQTAQAAAVADGASTVAALASGAIESNPLVNAAGLPLITAAKIALPYLVRGAEPATRKTVLVGASGLWGGAAVNNLLIVAGAGPIAIVGGIVAGIWFGFHAADKVDAEELAKAKTTVAAAATE